MKLDRAGMRSFAIVAAGLIFLAGCTALQPLENEAAGKEVYETQIITFTPDVPEAAKSGLCWTRSNIPFARRDVWRCMADNRVLDPCFVAGDEETIVCGANPALGEDGFKLDLTSPLPEMTYELGPGTPNLTWIIEAGDGMIYQFATGTTGSVEGKRINYVSKKSSVVIIGDLQPGKVWRAQKAILIRGRNSISIRKTEWIEIRRMWQ